MTRPIRIRSWSRAALLSLAAALSPASHAQSFCSSDGQTQPARLLERFTSADCESCWADGSAPAEPDELALDWIVPGTRGDGAPLSAAVSPDALARLAALRRPAPAGADAVRGPVQSPKRGLRVSHGLPYTDYIGASIELKQPRSERWTAWLLLVETIPAGTEGTSIDRNLVRNTLQLDWGTPARPEPVRRYESRPMTIPAGAQPERLRVVGLVQDGRGRIRAIAQSRCAPQPSGG